MTKTALLNAAHGTGPVIVDTDIGGDPDDYAALICAARSPRLQLVITTDETGTGDRARLARYVLDLLGREEVPVVAGAKLSANTKYWVMDGIIDQSAPVDTDVVRAVAQLCESSRDPLTWVGQGPLTNFATVADTRPDLIDCIHLVQMGGWIKTYRNPERASHNLRLDQPAAGLALRVARNPRLVMSEHTNCDAIDIKPDHNLYRVLERSGAPWAALAATNYSRWFVRGFPHSWLGDPATVAAGLGLPIVDFTTATVRIAADARLYEDPAGHALHVSRSIDGPALVEWVTASVQS